MLESIEQAMKQGNWEDAKHLAEQFIQIQPVNARAQAYLGLCHYRCNDFEKAIAPLQRAIVLDERFWEAGTLLAQTYDRLLRFEEALQVAERFLVVKPSDPTLTHLRDGLLRNVPEKITDSWQKSTQLDWHHVELTHRD